MQILHGCENGVSIEQLLENISELEREIIKEAPTDNDAEILLSSASVARHSVQYWHNNISKWHMCLNSKIVGVYEKIETKGRYDIPTAEEVAKYYIHYKDAPAGLYADPWNPERYIEIHIESNGAKIVLVRLCQEGLLFNSEMCACDWPWNYNVYYGVSLGQLAVADAIGGLLGAALGLCAGGLGAVPGAISVALTASATDGLQQLWSWIF